MEKAGLREKLSYRFDNFMAAGARSIFLALIVMFLAAFLVTGAVRLVVTRAIPDTAFADSKKTPLDKDVWNNFVQIIDPGGIAEDNDSPWQKKLVGIVAVFFGLIFFSAVIAFITTQLDIKIESLKKGRSRVIENDHILILGWGEQLTEIIRELIVANESESDACVVVMSELPKEQMDDYFNEHIEDRGTTRIITRTGLPSSLDSLERVSVTECRAVIILPSCNEGGTPEEKVISDAKTLKTLVAVVAASREDKTRAKIITEVFDKNRRDLMISLAPDNITMVDTEDMIAKIIVQTSRSSGLGVVYSHLIGFSGCEFYYCGADWGGIQFGSLPFHFKDGMPIGVRTGDGAVILKPVPTRPMEVGDEVIIIAEDDSTIKFSEKPLYTAREFALSGARLEKRLERELIIGWNTKARVIIEQYCDYIVDHSVIDVALSPDAASAVKEVEAIAAAKPNHRISCRVVNPLTELASLNPESYDNVIILNKVENDLEKVDSTTVTILLMLRQLFQETQRRTGKKVTTQIISEVMDSENLEIISRTGVNDFIISNQMVSKIFAQVVENPDILRVYEELFREEGAEIYLKPVSLYFKPIPAEEVSVAELISIAHKRNEVLIGYRSASTRTEIRHDFGVVVNPPKDRFLKLNAEDYLIVLAEDEL